MWILELLIVEGCFRVTIVQSFFNVWNFYVTIILHYATKKAYSIITLCKLSLNAQTC